MVNIVTPLVNMVTHTGMAVDVEKVIVQGYRCNKFASMKLRPLVLFRGENNSAFLLECIECYELTPFVFTKSQLSTPDVVINIVENVGDLNEQIQKESSRGACSKCKTGSYQSIDASMCNRMVLDIVECHNCHFQIPIISVVRSTLFAYSHDIQLAKKVAKDFPEIALVFCVAALETYFRQLFQYHSDLNTYLVQRRRVNFQSVDETKTILKKEFGIDIVKLIEKDWSFLRENFRKRHAIIHNASYDVAGKKIELSEQEIDKLCSIADDLVYKIEMVLFYNDVVI